MVRSILQSYKSASLGLLPFPFPLVLGLRVAPTPLAAHASRPRAPPAHPTSNPTDPPPLLSPPAAPVHNCDVMIREDIDEDEFIDVLIGNRKYVPCLYVRPPFSLYLLPPFLPCPPLAVVPARPR